MQCMSSSFVIQNLSKFIVENLDNRVKIYSQVSNVSENKYTYLDSTVVLNWF